uniref:GNAT family N-acetyltransferase n=1 Tax=Rathayibacter sp. FH 236 TaxID=2615183 RepID=A0A5J6SH94_9MICO|nr:GNAT family N-acetyltransferase [Rathayibacter sp. FH 236]
MNNCDINSPQQLIRLYDIGWPAASYGDVVFSRGKVLDLDDDGIIALMEQDLRFRSQLLVAMSRQPARVGVARGSDGIYAVCFYDRGARGEIGPVVLMGNQSSTVQEALVAATLGLMRRDGYRYAHFRGQLPLNDAMRSATFVIPAVLPTTPRSRDIVLPWGDIYFPVRGMTDVSDRLVIVDNRRIEVRRPRASEKAFIIDYISNRWGRGWGSEMEVAFHNQPFSCLVAVTVGSREPIEDWLMGFMSYHSTAPGFTASTAIDPRVKGSGLGLADALFSRALAEIAADGFDYAILGGVSRRTALLRASVNSFTIPGSYPGVFYLNPELEKAT